MVGTAHPTVTMSDYLPENWTSAHFDGELSAAEAARADRRLADDQVAREEVESFLELRDALSELPTYSLPSGFATAVLRDCEREMLLPAADTPGGPSISTSGTWRPVMAGLLATAALLFLGVRLATSPGQKPDRANTENAVAQNETNNTLERDNTVADNRRIAHNAASAPGKLKKEVDTGFAKKPKLSADNQADDKSKRDRAGITKGKTVPQISRQKFPAPMGKAGPNLLQSRIDGGSIRIGDVIPYLEVRGQKTAVIELTVVDVQRAVGQLEILLAKNIVNPPTNAKPKANLDYKKLIVPRFAAPKKSKQELVAVYVESNKLQLGAVMAALGRKTGAVHMKLKAPVTAGQVRVTQVAEHHLPRTNARKRNKQKSPLSLADAVAMAKGSYAKSTGFGGHGIVKKRPRRPTAPVRGSGVAAKQSAKAVRKKQGNSEGAAAGSKSNEPAKNKDVQAGKKNAAKWPPSFRLWMQLDNNPVSRRIQPTGSGAGGGGLGAKNGAAPKDGSKTATPSQVNPPPGQVRVIFVLRQRPTKRP